MAHAPVTRWTDGDRGPQADAEERITSVHRAIEIREKRRGPLVTSCLDYVALQATSDVNYGRQARDRPRDGQNAPFRRGINGRDRLRP